MVIVSMLIVGDFDSYDIDSVGKVILRILIVGDGDS